MSENLLNILSDSNKDIDNQKLMDYIGGKLSADQKHEVEQWMIDHPFFDDAVEGLQQAGDGKKVQREVDQINKQLAKYLQQRKVRKEKRILVNGWTYVAIVIILMLAVLVYFVISRL